jgi:DNA polymerase
MITLRREDVYICNVLKCRPPQNRDPQPNEIEACRSYLDRQIELVHPEIVVTLGRFSMARWFPGARISRIHGQPRRLGSRLYYPMYHPAAALHQPSLRRTIEEDMRRIPELIADAGGVRDEGPPEQARQLSLF